MVPLVTPLKTLSDSIRLCQKNELHVLQIRHPKAEAAISLHGGHLIQFKPAGEKDLIWISENAEFNPEKAIRGGVPVCWPWFGRIATPAHGFARTSQWQLLDHQEDSDKVIIRLTLTDDDNTRSIWPHAFQATLTFTLSSSVDIRLEVKNTASQPWRCSGALHSYFNLSNASDCHITGMGSDYLDSLNNNEKTQGGDQLPVDRSIDRIYLSPEKQINIHDAGWQRAITVGNSGHNAAVIWNPWAEITKGMGDMADDGYQTMVCVESTYFAKNLESGIEVKPGDTYILSTSIAVA